MPIITNNNRRTFATFLLKSTQSSSRPRRAFTAETALPRGASAQGVLIQHQDQRRAVVPEACQSASAYADHELALHESYPPLHSTAFAKVAQDTTT